METYLKAIESDMRQKKTVTGLNIARFVLWPEVILTSLSGGVTGPVGPVLTGPLFDAIVYYICNVCMWFSDLVLYTL